MKNIFWILIFLLIVSCKTKNKLDDLHTYTVLKKDFKNSIPVSGIIESNNIISYTCPLRGYDLTINYLMPEGIIVHKNDTLCRLVCAEIENQYLDAVKNLEMAKSELEKTQAQLDLESKLLESQVQSIEASAAISMLDSTRLEFYTPSKRKISELNLEKSKIEIGKYRRKIDYTRRINEAILNRLRIRIMQEENRVKRYAEQLDKLNLVADTTGILQYAYIWSTGNKAKIGDIVWGMSPIVNVINVSSLQVKLFVNESHFKLIQKDQKLDIRIDAGDSSIYKGLILSKSPGGKSLDGRRDSKVKYFEVFATINPLPQNIQPGVSVSCQILLNECKDTIAIPLMSVFEQDSTKIVYLIEKNKCKKKVVKTGTASEKEIIISEGLKPKDKILLNEPPESLLHQ